MNMDYSKAFELLNQDAEKERNKKAEKAVHDNLYYKGFRDGLAVLDKIRAEIESLERFEIRGEKTPLVNGDKALEIIDKYRAESGDLGVEKNEWIYRTMPDEGVDFDKIEKALGFKLFVWQKTFITRGVFRQYGATTARCIRRLLQKDNPIDYRKRIVHAQELFERQEMIRIHDQLQAAGVEVCEILRPERKK